MDTRQSSSQRLLDGKKMTQISASIILASVAFTSLIYRRKIFFELFIGDVYGFIKIFPARNASRAKLALRSDAGEPLFQLIYAPAGAKDDKCFLE